MFWRGTLQVFFFIISLFSVIQLCKGEECKTVAFLPEDKGSYLKNHTKETVTTDTQTICRIQCYLSNHCVSYNYHQRTGTCEINDSDNFQHPGDLIRRDGYVYHATKNDCQTKPCPVNSTCKQNFISGGYRCLCSFEYLGRPHIDCEFPYQKVGCFKDRRASRSLPELILTYKDENSPKYEKPYHGQNNLYNLYFFIESMRWFISRCAFKTKEKGFQVFGIQNEWECWSGPDGENSYSKYGKEDKTKCFQGKYTAGCEKNNPQACFGLANVNYVYKLL
ncbi:uncharacterized protein LOC116305691 [Actinia tenebrosa]|uniref:Uncharacterized protein LOC116305691 n=1 Tax=Actinia tenebrosa TaxID=6105 RepID=A0A6P8J005_ACTTE|nr:uncharacterized protein LOC116305691 [Actinia tenebrosa]